MELTKMELDARRVAFVRKMDEQHPDWDCAIIISKVNQYYFTGSMQDGLVLIRRDGTIRYYVRLSIERARDESPIDDIRPYRTYRDIAACEDADLGHMYFEMDVVPYATVERLKRAFHFKSLQPLDGIVRGVRAVKSAYELHWIERAGAMHRQLLEEEVPALLREGMSEADLVGVVFEKMMALGYQGMARFSMFETEIVTGQYGFGENSLYPTCFDGPGGSRGLCAAAPVGGSRERKLKKGDLVFVDIGFGLNGYHSDKTQVYLFGAKPNEETLRAHQGCIDVMNFAAARLVPGADPEAIYLDALGTLDDFMRENFMGFGQRTVKFLGHGVGLHVDELPVIAERFHMPLQENMVIALEPKRGVAGVGMAGVEETFIVTPAGGRVITGGPREIIVVE